MLIIVTPSNEAILELQDLEQSLYFSAATEGVLRREGMISTAGLVAEDLKRAPEDAAFLFTRGVQLSSAQLGRLRGRPLAFEGPLADATMDELGLSAKSRTVERLELFTPDGKSRWTIFRPRVEIGNPRRDATRPRVWSNPTIRVQIFRKVKLRNILLGMTLPDGTHAPAIFLHRGIWVCALPLFDLFGQHFCFPPLTDRYITRKRPSRLGDLEAQICAGLADFAAAGATVVSCERWPEGYKAALTVRHDYDRAISAGEHKQLMDLYRRNGVKVSMSYLAYLLPRGQMHDFVAHGHETQIHVHESDGPAVSRAVEKISAAAGTPVTGATIHGGSSGIGFRGDISLDWLERAGLAYTESFSIDGYPSPLYRPDPMGLLRRSRLVASPMHVSLDVSMDPEAHRLEHVRESVAASLAAGLMAIPMNHPDLHRRELEAVVDGLPKEGVWFATLGEVCEWERRSKYDPLASFSGGKLMLDFCGALSHPAVMTLRQPGYPVRRVTLPAGSLGLTLNSWGGVRVGAVPKNVPQSLAPAGLRGLVIKQVFLRKAFLFLVYLARALERHKSRISQKLRDKGHVALISRVAARLDTDAENAQIRPSNRLVLQKQKKDDAIDLLALAAGEARWPAGVPVLGASVAEELHPLTAAALTEVIRQVSGRPVTARVQQQDSPPPSDADAVALAGWIATEARRGVLQRSEMAYFLASTSLRVRAIADILDSLEIRTLDMLVEHGAGVGMMSWLLSRQKLRIGNIALIEPVERFAEPLASLWRAAEGANYDHFPVVSEEFEYPGSADVIIICHTLFRVAPEQRDSVLKRAWEALRPGGVLIVNELLTDRESEAGKLVYKAALLESLQQFANPALYLLDKGWQASQDPRTFVAEEVGSTGFFVVRKDAVEERDALVDIPLSPAGRPFDPAWFAEKEITVRASGEQILRGIVSELALQRDTHVMDVADHVATAAGPRTGELLAEMVAGPVLVLEARAEIARFLADHFQSRATVHHSRFLAFPDTDRQVGLIVLDLVSAVMMRDFEQLLRKARGLLKTGGHLVTFFIHDVPAAFDSGRPALNPVMRSTAENFLQSWFGRDRVSLRTIREKLWSEGFGARGLVDRRATPSGGVAWLILEKL